MVSFAAILEDNRPRAATMRRILLDLLPDVNTVVFADSASMMQWLDRYLRSTVLISLDHDLYPGESGTDPGTGRQVADYLATLPCVCPVIVHTSNVEALPGMLRALREANWTCSCVVPHEDVTWISTAWRGEVEQYVRRGLVLI
jgi:hypothetical protein